MQTLTDAMEAVRRLVDQRLATALDAAILDAKHRANDAVPMMEQIHALTVRGGKRLRPVMVMAAVECTTPWESMRDATIDVGAAIELLQTYLLIHDDWMDGDTVRRGGPTVHVALAKAYGHEHNGASSAILAGDMACALAQELVVHAELPGDRLRETLRAFVTMQREVILGQTLDVLGAKDIDVIHDLKTGSYTVRGPIALGHALAGGSQEAWGALEAFARPIGIAFQLRDDIIGTFGDEKETGKTSATDLRVGKRTAPVVFALERLDAKGRAELESLLGKDDDNAVARARTMIEEIGARAAVEERIVSLRDRAMASLEHGSIRREGAKLLSGLAHVMTDRRK
jgi:geranylgeranyl diphosphate synthase type I